MTGCVECAELRVLTSGVSEGRPAAADDAALRCLRSLAWAAAAALPGPGRGSRPAPAQARAGPGKSPGHQCHQCDQCLAALGRPWNGPRSPWPVPIQPAGGRGAPLAAASEKPLLGFTLPSPAAAPPPDPPGGLENSPGPALHTKRQLALCTRDGLCAPDPRPEL